MKGTTYVNPIFFAGFTLAGYRQPDGTIKASSGMAKLNGWPEEITIEGVTFTREEIVTCGESDQGVFENAEYV